MKYEPIAGKEKGKKQPRGKAENKKAKKKTLVRAAP
jgi:hypothetical protein